MIVKWIGAVFVALIFAVMLYGTIIDMQERGYDILGIVSVIVFAVIGSTMIAVVLH